MLSNKIYLNVFIMSLAIGIFLLYILGDDRKTVYIYPNIDTYKNILFHDTQSDLCYQYKPIQIKCPTDSSKIIELPSHTPPII